MMRRALFMAALVALPFAIAEFVEALGGRLLLPFPVMLVMQLVVLFCVGGAAFYVPRDARSGGRVSIFALKPYMPRFPYVLLLLIVCGTALAAPIAVIVTGAIARGSEAPEAIIGVLFGGGWASLLTASALCLRYVRDQPGVRDATADASPGRVP